MGLNKGQTNSIFILKSNYFEKCIQSQDFISYSCVLQKTLGQYINVLFSFKV